MANLMLICILNIGVLQALANSEGLLTREQCRSLCSAEQNATDTWSPKSTATTSEKENRTTIADVVGANLDLLKKAMTHLSTQSCDNIPFEFAKLRNETGGVFDIFIPSKLQWVEVYCDMTTDGGNWIVFQRRMDGSVDFNRDWEDYVNGFGSASGEFWLGLEMLHKLTTNGTFELRIDMKQIYNGRHYYAKYGNFKVGPASENYRLLLTGFSGDATDAMSDPPTSSAAILTGMEFSTRDRDNDRSPVGCAILRGGGWWHNDCNYANLNGPFRDGKIRSEIRWLDQRINDFIQLNFVEIKFRKKK